MLTISQFTAAPAGARLAVTESVSGLTLTLREFNAGRRDLPLEAVFRALDGRDVDVEGDPCHVEVCGVYDDGGRRWVQLALAGQRPRMMTIRLGAEPLDVVSKFN